MVSKKNAETESIMESKVTSLDVTKKAIQKKFGTIIKPMSDKPLIINTISTRSIGLDVALGRGGFALGRIYEIYGPNSAGKTTLAISLIAEAQSRGMRCLFVDAEHAADPKLFESMGVDLTKLDVIDMYIGEDILSATEAYMSTGEVDLVVIDSVSSLIPKVAADGEIEDTTIALLARLMSKTLLRFTPIAAQTNTCVIFINQIRHKIGVMMGNPETTTGGLALGFYTTGRVRVSGVGSKQNRILDSKGTVIGHKTKFEVIKNRLAAPFTEAEVDLIYGRGYDTEGEIIKIAADLGILSKSGSWYKYSDTNIGQGENGVRNFFRENPDVFLTIKQDMTDVLGLTSFYKSQEEYDVTRTFVNTNE
jgi:recombination protein RecA